MAKMVSLKGVLVVLAMLMVSLCGCSEKTKVRLLYWNIQNGMWSDQPRNYNLFVDFVNSFSPDICVWCEAESIYKSGTAEALDSADKYLPGGWGELAARYGHSYWYIGGHRDSYPQVITSKYPIENVKRIIGEEPDSVVTHGSGWARIAIENKELNIVTLHTWPQKYAFRAADRQASREENGGDKYRLMEIEYICKSTICGHKDASAQNWIMLGDFNSRSRADNFEYNYNNNDSRFWVHDYIAKNTPYIDIIAKLYPNEFYTTMPGKSRIDFVYCTEPLFKGVVQASVVVDEFTTPVRDSLKLSNFYYPSDHRPIFVVFEMD